MSAATQFSPQAAALLADAMRLTEAERGELAERLIVSLDPATEADAEQAWSAEIRHRLEELCAGKVQPIPWAEARRMIEEEDDAAGTH